MRVTAAIFVVVRICAQGNLIITICLTKMYLMKNLVQLSIEDSIQTSGGCDICKDVYDFAVGWNMGVTAAWLYVYNQL
ncbi:hypothetical protein FGF1_34660 [Flavobacteriaceae bacterium GF1]